MYEIVFFSPSHLDTTGHNFGHRTNSWVGSISIFPGQFIFDCCITECLLFFHDVAQIFMSFRA